MSALDASRKRGSSSEEDYYDQLRRTTKPTSSIGVFPVSGQIDAHDWLAKDDGVLSFVGSAERRIRYFVSGTEHRI